MELPTDFKKVFDKFTNEYSNLDCGYLFRLGEVECYTDWTLVVYSKTSVDVPSAYEGFPVEIRNISLLIPDKNKYTLTIMTPHYIYSDEAFKEKTLELKSIFEPLDATVRSVKLIRGWMVSGDEVSLEPIFKKGLNGFIIEEGTFKISDSIA